jgi:hypothetical protein
MHSSHNISNRKQLAIVPRILLGLSVLATLCSILPAATAHAAEPPPAPCERACLYAIADQYMAALVDGNTSAAPVARNVKFSENGILLDVGDGLWNTISGVRGYNLKLADPQLGQVALIEVVEEHGVPAIMAARFKVEDGLITEIETVLSRKIDTSPFPVTEGYTTPHALWSTPADPATRKPRERMISVADGYFDTIQLNDGTLFTQFTDDCDRVENGLLTTHNPDIPNYDIAKMGCAEQFELGQYIYDDRLRDRRFPLVDEEMGVVLAAGFMDHTGKVMDVTWTDGTKQKSIFFYPHTFILIELFKIEGNAIQRVEAVFASMPYNMPSVW